MNRDRMRVDRYRYIATWYDVVAGPLTRAFMLRGLKLFRPEPGMEILDVGCGSGRQLDLYRRYGCKLHGIDSSPAMLEVARRRLAGAADLRLADALRLPYANGTFDLVLCTLVLHGMAPHRRARAVEEMRRVVKESGRILMVDFRQPCVLTPLALLTKLIVFLFEAAEGPDNLANYRRFISVNNLPQLVSGNRLRIEKATTRRKCNLQVFLLSKRFAWTAAETERNRLVSLRQQRCGEPVCPSDESWVHDDEKCGLVQRSLATACIP